MLNEHDLEWAIWFRCPLSAALVLKNTTFDIGGQADVVIVPMGTAESVDEMHRNARACLPAGRSANFAIPARGQCTTAPGTIIL